MKRAAEVGKVKQQLCRVSPWKVAFVEDIGVDVECAVDAVVEGVMTMMAFVIEGALRPQMLVLCVRNLRKVDLGVGVADEVGRHC